MAILPNKKGVVTGTQSKDKIVWYNPKSKLWKRKLTVKAGDGNDTIDFSKSKFANKINGGDGADIIKGGKKNDKINGGKHKDTIYTGAGTNTVVINKGDGNDIIYNQGNAMLVKMGSVNTQDMTAWQKKGNDLIMTYAHVLTKSDKKKQVKEVVTLKNYFKNDGTIANNNVFLNAKNNKIFSLFESEGLEIVPVGRQYKGSYLDDKISGSAGNDTIYGFDGDDKINGGAGNDTINAGKGKNTIYHVHIQGDGTDIIENGGGEDTLVLTEAADFEYLSGYASGNNVVFKYDYGDSVVLKDYLKGNHSLKWVQIGKVKLRPEEIRNRISSNYTDTTIKGTRWCDEITVNSVMEPVVEAGDGDDLIHIDTSYNVDVIAGKGDDIININWGTYNVDINLQSNCGNDRLTGLSNIYPNYGVYGSHIGFYGAEIVSQAVAENGIDLVLTLQGGNTFIIEDFYILSDADQSSLFGDSIGNLSSQAPLLSCRNAASSSFDTVNLKSEIASWESINSMSNNSVAEFIPDNTNNYDICQIYSS